MLAATAVMTCMHASVRHVSDGLHPFEIAFFRNLFGLLTVMPIAWGGGVAGLTSRQPGVHLLRSLFGIFAMLSWFYSLSVVPIADATALSFTAVIFGSVGAALFLGERMRVRRWTAVAVGLTGALVILRPGFEEVDAGSLLVLFSSVCWASALLTVKRLSRTDSTVCIVTWNSLLLTLLSLPAALAVWQWPSPVELGWLALIGGLATVGHLAMTSAFKAADASVVFPVDYTRLVWASLLGYLVFGDPLDAWTWVGGTIIFASTTYIALRERKAKSP